ncbi:hypothetical protein [Kutzneria kofuensis]|uniref:Uncharacterized protein n=1 Tax=Kutzneria kofuensis TaxID=103725 RepID=A0A7W9KH74_9PSEU|nr:hypothetical protein [Kutzneria kofuensis]MBB5892546.1 hypothetical protein [Kutzneria kofuensis]
MTWQEELRALDAELADKGITPAEYRRRRDNLLAAASGGFPPAGQVAPQRPVSAHPDQPAQPTPPVQQPPVQSHQSHSPAQAQAPSQPVQQQAPPSQPVPGPPSQPFANPAIQPMPSAQQPNNHSVPPWSAVTELPMYQPLADQQAPAPQYAPRPPLDEDIFNARMTKKKSRAALLVVVVVVVLLLLAGGWWFGVRPRTEAASTPPAPKALHLEDIPALPGTARLDRAELSVFEGQNRGLFDAREGDFLQADKVSQVTFTGSADGKVNYVVFAFVTDSTAAAKKTSADLLEYQDLGGLHPVDGSGLPDQVKVVKLVAGDQVQYRAIYASGLNAVMVAVAQAQPADESSVAKALHDAVTALLTKAPAS